MNLLGNVYIPHLSISITAQVCSIPFPTLINHNYFLCQEERMSELSYKFQFSDVEYLLKPLIKTDNAFMH